MSLSSERYLMAWSKKLAEPTSSPEVISFTDLCISNRWNNPKCSPRSCDKPLLLMEYTGAIGVTTFGDSLYRGDDIS
jgi:hypothetical protein